jgi:hypothetical protein
LRYRGDALQRGGKTGQGQARWEQLLIACPLPHTRVAAHTATHCPPRAGGAPTTHQMHPLACAVSAALTLARSLLRSFRRSLNSLRPRIPISTSLGMQGRCHCSYAIHSMTTASLSALRPPSPCRVASRQAGRQAGIAQDVCLIHRGSIYSCGSPQRCWQPAQAAAQGAAAGLRRAAVNSYGCCGGKCGP